MGFVTTLLLAWAADHLKLTPAEGILYNANRRASIVLSSQTRLNKTWGCFCRFHKGNGGSPPKMGNKIPIMFGWWRPCPYFCRCHVEPKRKATPRMEKEWKIMEKESAPRSMSIFAASTWNQQKRPTYRLAPAAAAAQRSWQPPGPARGLGFVGVSMGSAFFRGEEGHWT